MLDFTREEQFAWTSYLRIAAISAVVCTLLRDVVLNRRQVRVAAAVFGVHLAVIGVFADRILPASADTWPGAPLTRTFPILAVALVGSFGVTALIKQIPVLRRVV